MKKLLFCGLVSVSLLSLPVTGHCWPWEKKTVAEPKKTMPVSQAPAPKVQAEPSPVKMQEQKQEVAKPAPVSSRADLDKEKAKRDRIKGLLNNTQWEVDLTALSGKGVKEKDNLNFKGNQFYADKFSDQGFKPSNYTLTLQENGNAVIETMQTSTAGNIIFWRIEFDPSLTVCKGVLSRQLSDNKTEDYSFLSVAKRPIPPPVPEAPKELKEPVAGEIRE